MIPNWLRTTWVVIAAIVVGASIAVWTINAHADQYDYLLNYPDQATAQADPVLAPFWHAPDSDNPSGSWDQSQVFPGETVYSVVGGQPVAFPGWWVWVSVSKSSNVLVTDPALVIAADRDLALAGNPAFMFYVTTNLTPQQLDAAFISPEPLGSNYPFGNAP